MTESIELKPCPFCGGEVRWCCCGEETDNGCHHITCERCGNFDFANGHLDGGETLEELRECMVAKWNTRHADSAEIDQLRARVAELQYEFQMFVEFASGCDGWEQFPAKHLDHAFEVISRSEPQSLAAVQAKVLEKLAAGCWGSVNGRGSVLSYEEIKAEADRIRKEAGL